MRLHKNKERFRQAVQATSDKMEILPIYVEKDYWVTFALHILFQSPIGKDTVFKGGTALSKCYDMIERFSEDIDLVMLRRDGESNNQMTNKIRKVSRILDPVMPEMTIEGLTQKMGMNRKTAHTYPKLFDGDYGQVRDVIVVEATWLGYFEPYTTRKIVSFVGDMMLNQGQKDLAEEYELLPFDVRVLEPKRTICEKIMSLVRFSYTETPIDDLKKKIRHIYDIHQLLKKDEFQKFLASEDFEAMLLKVAQDDVESFKNNNAWLEYHPNESLMFEDVDGIWNDLKETYLSDFSNLVYGTLPKEEDVCNSLNLIKDRMKEIKWSIDPRQSS